MFISVRLFEDGLFMVAHLRDKWQCRVLILPNPALAKGM
jgi:hypothetical protein